jgi:hypothetical protein
MTCHDARELFSALADGALTAPERAALDARLAGCAECRRELERVRATVTLLRAVEPARAPAGFVDRVLAAARPVPWYRRLARAVLLPWPVKLPLEAAAIVLVGAAVALVLRGTPELDQIASTGDAPRVTEAPRRLEPATPAPPHAIAPPAPTAAPAPGAPREEPPAKRALEDRGAELKSTGEGERARRLSGRSLPRADVAGRLAVADRHAAERALRELLARVGGREVARRAVPGGAVVELAVPRAGFPDFARGLEAIGRWQPAPAQGDLPAEVRVEVILGG